MRLSIHTLGTRGDVQPYLALAEGLARRGHNVQVAAPAQFAPMFEGNEIGFVPLPAEFLGLLKTPEGEKALGQGLGLAAGLKLLRKVRPLMGRVLEQEWTAAAAFEPDAMIYHPKSVAAPSMAERLAVPAFLASPLPGFTPTSAFPSPVVPFADLGPLNRASHLLSIHGAGMLFGKLIRKWRQEALGLSARSGGWKPTATIYAYSRHVVPVPLEWTPDVLVSGYWFRDAPEWQPPAELAHFLAAGAPPIYVGFGSMPGGDERLTRLVVEVLAGTGSRGILATGGGALAAAAGAPHIHVLGTAPHDRLFPLMAATIHHGGAGTTGASLRAGLPTAVCPFFGDQPFWARRVAALGAGPARLDRKTLTPVDLINTIRCLKDSTIQARAVELGALISSEDGVATAVNFIEQRCAARA
ncbi:glycosyltransferase [Devosia sp. RR2S18]|uniref:glycosyltransferase n=1 Tax=Devosia rhizosphaerae TaxID=3049774 RepID=UPI00254266AD|nr:glycosyltransferase [Devosia sp. RR2S18]WIJ24457.1 glycosyltransferase [Devosia sp. RR2S18]